MICMKFQVLYLKVTKKIKMSSATVVISSLMVSMLGKFSFDDILKCFAHFPRKQALTFHANCLQHCLFSGEKILPFCELQNLPRDW